VTAYFGEIAPLSRPPKFFPKGYSRLLPNIMMISNIRENGETIGALPDGEMHFHHDQIHSEVPHNGTLLYSLEIPDRGGDTLFASGYAAYDTLDSVIKAETRRLPRLPPLQLRHDYPRRQQRHRGLRESNHPIFRTHDETGRKAIYVNRLMTMRIDGLLPEESDTLLAALFDSFREAGIRLPPCLARRRPDRVGQPLLDARARRLPLRSAPLMFRTTVKGGQRPY